jgi:hypothetical protein
MGTTCGPRCAGCVYVGLEPVATDPNTGICDTGAAASVYQCNIGIKYKYEFNNSLI